MSFRRSPKKLRFEALDPRQLLTIAPLLITEFMASNDETLLDGDGNSSDWIEIHNPTADPVSLDGWYLSDDQDEPTKWPLPPQQIEADEYLLVFASGQSTNNYIDRNGNPHTNFKLKREGEYLGLTHVNEQLEATVVSEFAPSFPLQYEDVSYGTGISTVIETLIAPGAAVQFLVPNDDAVDSTWMDVEFDASEWTPGVMGVGYENSPADYQNLIQSRVPVGTDSAYVRVPFDVQRPSDLDSLELRVKFDDGFVAYLNGEPLQGVRRNAPSALDFRSVATGNHPDRDAVEFVAFNISSDLGLLRSGTNVLALHSLNQASSSDMLILAELQANRPTDTERVATGYFVSPTPGESNSTGASNPGPITREVTANPGAIDDDTDFVITAQVEALAAAVSDVRLHYRTNYATEKSLSMRDDGENGDALAADGIYSAVIPSTESRPGDMLRWYVTATDAQGMSSRNPAFLDDSGNNQSPEYFGTVIERDFATSLPIFQWFSESVSASHQRSGTRASVFYNGRFYDNVFVRQRGGGTNSSQSQKFDFNKDHSLFVSEDLGSVGEINLNGNGSDPSYLRQSMGFEAHSVAGGNASASFPTLMYVNGQIDRVGVWIEQVDEDFLERQGYDSDGDLYKLVQRSNLQPAIGYTTTGVEQKTGDELDLATFADLVRGVELRTEQARQRFLRDHLDLAQVINYMAVRSLQHQADDVRKNIYLYNDTAGDGLWRIYPWDLDWTFNIVGGHDNQDSTRTEHPFWGVEAFPTADGANQWNKLYEALFETEEIQEMFLRRLRTLMDEFYGGRTGGTTWFAEYVDAHFPRIDPFVEFSATNGRDSLLRSIEDRRRELYSVYTRQIPGYSVVIPSEQPERPQFSFGALDFNPVSGNQDEEYIELTNPNDFAVDISDWELRGGISHTFQPGTVVPSGVSLYVTASVADFRNRTSGPSGDQGLFVQEWQSGHLSNFSEPLELLMPDGSSVAELSYEGEPTPNQLFLRITEVYYNPEEREGDLTTKTQRLEFIELMNVSTDQTLDLAGVHFSEGLAFEFPQVETALLEPGGIVLITADDAALLQRFSVDQLDGAWIAGNFKDGTQLSNGGERLKLEDADGSTILDFRYDDESPWPTLPDGGGASLAIRDFAANRNPDVDYASPANWIADDPTPGRYILFDLPGDANRDGTVNFSDFLILSANFGKEASGFENGDFDNNGAVNFADFLMLSENFGRRV